ncbi:ASKHA domain-containing protein [Amylibacter sp.]|nr:ASKHA domain-containing protein [Amylibacter sp.]
MENKNNPLVIFTPSGKRGVFPVGTPILTAARQLGVDLDSVCGGRGICSRCQITPSFGEFSKHGVTVENNAISDWNSVEERYKSKRGMIDGRRLGCQATIQGNIVIDVPPESQVHKQVVRKRAEARDIFINPTTRLFYVEVEQPDMHKPSGDLERLIEALDKEWNLTSLEADFSILKKIQTALRKGEWKVTCAIHSNNNSNKSNIVEIWPGYYEGSIYGMAVDLGSTTIAAHLCDLQTGEVVASSGSMNPQIRFGEDLMSRVSYSMMNSKGDEEMTSAVRAGMNELFSEVAQEANISTNLIMDAVFVCNPVMHHLFLGIDPFELGQAPFALATSNAINMKSSNLELSQMHSASNVYLLPCIAGHVGADAAAVALSESPNTSEDLVLIVDVGTNAEILLGNKDKVLACSSPTGPAFEGAQISSGQRAAPGAIEHVEIDPTTKDPRFKVIGSDYWSDEIGFEDSIKSSGITGICGSGIIEMVAEMRMAGIVDGPGLIGSPEQTATSRCFQDGRTFSYLVYDGSASNGPKITITNRDIREIQMAKAALYSGARLLMDKFEVDNVDRIVLAGAFGAHISPKHAMALGMIPDCKLKNVSSAGNAAGTGARIALLNHSARSDIEKIVTEIHKIETAIEPRFQEHFVNASAIPNSVEKFPILETHVNLPLVNFNMGNSKEGSRRRRRN